MKHKLHPFQRYIEILEIWPAQEEKESTVLIPDDVNTKTLIRYAPYRVFKIAANCGLSISREDVVLVEVSQIEEIIYLGEKHLYVSENHIVAKVERVVDYKNPPPLPRDILKGE